MAQFDSQYPVQVSPEMEDKILIAAAQDGKIMALPFGKVIAYIQKYMNEIDDELSLSSLRPVQNRIITKAINDIMTQVQPGSDNKEVIIAKTAGSDPPTGSLEEGDVWIDLDAQTLRIYDGDGAWDGEEPGRDVIYITEDTSKIYLWNGTEFVLSSSELVDNTIIYNPANYITKELDNTTSPGLYKVRWLDEYDGDKFYSMVVSSYSRRKRIIITIDGVPRPAIITITTVMQILYNHDGYQYRSSSSNDGDEEGWSEWTRFMYASQDQLNTELTARINTEITARNAAITQAKNELLPRIYAGY